MVSPQQVARDTAEIGLARLVAALALILPSLALVRVLANFADYREPGAVVAVWLAVIGAGAWFARRPRMGGLAARGTAAAVALAVTAVTVTGAACQPHGNPGTVDLAILGTAWLLVLIAVSHSARVWIPVALLVFAVQGATLIYRQGLNLLSLSQLGAAGYIIAAIVIVFAALRPALDLRVALASRQASMASRSAAERAAADAIRRERRGRLAVLEQEALPLLRGVADGTIDPADEEVRARCARHAAALRSALTEGAPSGGLAAVIEPAVRAAAARGLPVTVQLIGDQGAMRPPVARAVLAAVDVVLSALPPHQVVLTVLATGDETELYLAFEAPLRAAPDLARFGRDVPAAARWRAVLHATEAGGGFLELGWRREGAG